MNAKSAPHAFVLTENSVNSLPHPESGQKLYRDTNLIGFGVCVGKRKKTFFVECSSKGKTIRRVLGEHGNSGLVVDRARSLAAEALNLLKAGEPNIRTERATSEPLSSLLHRYEATLVTRKYAVARDELLYLVRFMLDRPITDLTRQALRLRHKRMDERIGREKATHVMSFLRGAFDFAIANPAPGTEALQVNPIKRDVAAQTWHDERKTGLPTESLPQFWKALTDRTRNGTDRDQTVSDYLITVLLLGLRRKEAAMLRWGDVDLGRAEVRIGPLAIPLVPYLCDLFAKRLSSATSEFVFPSAGSRGYLVQLDPRLRQVTDELGVKFSVEDLRRTHRAVAKGLSAKEHEAVKAASDQARQRMVAITRVSNELLRLATG